MKKLYYFWLDDQKHFDKNNPLSAGNFSNSIQARRLAKRLLILHKDANWCQYMAENGRKVYQENK